MLFTPAMITTTAAVFTEPGAPLTTEALDLEDPRAGEVRVRLGASGICHSDLHVRDGEWSAPTPLVLGHEGAGVVDAIGDGVRDVAVGDHVVLSWMYPCRRCRACVSGRAWACTGSRSDEYLLEDGTTRLRRADGSVVYPRLAVGTFAGDTVVPESAAVRIPDAVPSTSPPSSAARSPRASAPSGAPRGYRRAPPPWSSAVAEWAWP